MMTAVSTGNRPTTAAVQQAMQAALPTIQAGFEVFDRQSGTVVISQNASQPVAAMSVVKLLIALDVLAGLGGIAPDNATQQELHQMLAASDDEIADQLWSADGGPAMVTRMVGLLGLTGTRPPNDPGEWGDTEITPQDMVTVYRYITDQLPQPDRDLVIGALASAPQIAADSFNQYFGIPRGMPQTTWAIKQGWGTSGSQAPVNAAFEASPDDPQGLAEAMGAQARNAGRNERALAIERRQAERFGAPTLADYRKVYETSGWPWPGDDVIRRDYLVADAR